MRKPNQRSEQTIDATSFFFLDDRIENVGIKKITMTLLFAWTTQHGDASQPVARLLDRRARCSSKRSRSSSPRNASCMIANSNPNSKSILHSYRHCVDSDDNQVDGNAAEQVSGVPTDAVVAGVGGDIPHRYHTPLTRLICRSSRQSCKRMGPGQSEGFD